MVRRRVSIPRYENRFIGVGMRGPYVSDDVDTVDRFICFLSQALDVELGFEFWPL